jgi:hypothetical protein
MKFRQHLNTKLKDGQFKQLYDEEREMLDISLKLLNAKLLNSNYQRWKAG